jgi:hypothetical protein
MRVRPAAKKISPHLVLSIPAFLMATLPLILIGLVIVPALFTLIFVFPFLDLGKTQARKDCTASASNYSIAHYLDEQQSGESKDRQSSARLLQCNSAFCILIQDGEAIVVPSSSLRSLEGGSIGKRWSYTPAPENEQLCSKPRSKTPPKTNGASQTPGAAEVEKTR